MNNKFVVIILFVFVDKVIENISVQKGINSEVKRHEYGCWENGKFL